jgi:hypothetical protein
MTEKHTDLQMLIENVRLSYAYLFKPYENDDGSKSYCSHLILDANHPQIEKFKGLMRKAATEFWKDEAPAILQQLAAQDRLCLHRGDVTKPGQDAYKGRLYISTNSKIRPTIIDGDRSPLQEGDANAPYSGCRANAIVGVWVQANQYGKRINAQLMGVQFVKHDERLGGGGKVAAADEFGVVAGDADTAAPATAGGDGLI